MHVSSKDDMSLRLWALLDAWTDRLNPKTQIIVHAASLLLRLLLRFMPMTVSNMQQRHLTMPAFHSVDHRVYETCSVPISLTLQS